MKSQTVCSVSVLTKRFTLHKLTTVSRLWIYLCRLIIEKQQNNCRESNSVTVCAICHNYPFSCWQMSSLLKWNCLHLKPLDTATSDIAKSCISSLSGILWYCYMTTVTNEQINRWMCWVTPDYIMSDVWYFSPVDWASMPAGLASALLDI